MRCCRPITIGQLTDNHGFLTMYTFPSPDSDADAYRVPGRWFFHLPQSPTGSEHNLDKDGPAAVVSAVIEALGVPSATVVGYDWGAGIALSMGHSKSYKRLVDKIVAFHPAYNEKSPDELQQVAAPTMLVWCKQDAFHNWVKWKVLAKKLATSLGPKYRELIISEKEWDMFASFYTIVLFSIV